MSLLYWRHDDLYPDGLWPPKNISLEQAEQFVEGHPSGSAFGGGVLGFIKEGKALECIRDAEDEWEINFRDTDNTWFYKQDVPTDQVQEFVAMLANGDLVPENVTWDRENANPKHLKGKKAPG